MTFTKQLQQVEKERDERLQAYESVKATMHRLQDLLMTLLDRFDAHADGVSDATPLDAFCNEMIGLYNDISVGDARTLKQERDHLRGCDAMALIESMFSDPTVQSIFIRKYPTQCQSQAPTTKPT